MEHNENKLSHYQLAASQQKKREAKEIKYKDKSKKRLSNIVNTKIKTSFIGAISSCEKNFGFLSKPLTWIKVKFLTNQCIIMVFYDKEYKYKVLVFKMLSNC